MEGKAKEYLITWMTWMSIKVDGVEGELDRISNVKFSALQTFRTPPLGWKLHKKGLKLILQSQMPLLFCLPWLILSSFMSWNGPGLPLLFSDTLRDQKLDSDFCTTKVVYSIYYLVSIQQGRENTKHGIHRIYNNQSLSLGCTLNLSWVVTDLYPWISTMHYIIRNLVCSVVCREFMNTSPFTCNNKDQLGI